MLSFGLPPTEEQNDRGVQVLLDHGDIEGVFELLAAIADAGVTKSSWISQRRACMLAKRLFATKDERVWGVLDTAEELGIDMAEITRHLARDEHGRRMPKIDNLGHLQGASQNPVVDQATSSWELFEKASGAGSG
jgi:hypothetical protein